MTTPCKLLRLPLIVIEEVVSNMDFLELFNLSLCSQKSQKLISIMRKVPSILIDVQINWDKKSVKACSAKNSDLIHFEWHFLECKKSGEPDRVIRKIGGMETDTRNPMPNRKFPGPVSYAPRNRLDLTINAAISHFLDTFHHCKISYLRIGFEGLCTQFRASRAFKSIKSVATLDMKSEMFGSIQEMKFLLSNVEVRERLRHKSALSLGTTIVDQLKCSKEVFCENCSWMRPETLWNIDCPFIYLYKTRFSGEDIQEFLRRWQVSVGEDKEKIEVVFINHPLGLSLDYGALDARPWDPAVRPKDFPLRLRIHQDSEALHNTSFDCSRGMDIRRTDGRIGTILRFTDTAIKFFVWPK